MNNKTYIILLDILRKCREELISGYSGQATDLSRILFRGIYESNIQISNKYIELFKLTWIKSHWNHIEERIEKKLIFSLFAKFFIKFIDFYKEDIPSCSLGKHILEEQIHVLKMIISSNKDLDNNIKEFEILSLRDIKLINDEIERLKRKQ